MVSVGAGAGTGTASFPRERLVTPAARLGAIAAALRAALPTTLPAPLVAQLETVHVPVAAYLAERRAALGRTIVVGLGGGQGAGKSTLAALWVRALELGFGLRAAAVSLDDFYLTKAERERLASTVHPELRTRGPGTHDVALAERTLRALRDAGPGVAVRVPRFDKAADDRVPEPAWTEIGGPLDVVVLEGVLVGVPPEPDPDPDPGLDPPINAFERERDPDGRLRRHARAQLRQLGGALDPLLDVRVFLAVPDLARVLAWRTEQERALGSEASGQQRGMDATALARFVARFERLTLHALRTAPALAEVVLELDAEHRVNTVALTPRAAVPSAR